MRRALRHKIGFWYFGRSALYVDGERVTLYFSRPCYCMSKDLWGREPTPLAVVSIRRRTKRQLRKPGFNAMTNAQEEIAEECDRIKELLLRKNKLYGNSAAQPARMFSPETEPLQQIAVRCDDKISRIRSMGGLVAVLGKEAADGEDTVQDLIGYLILARVVASQQEQEE